MESPENPSWTDDPSSNFCRGHVSTGRLLTAHILPRGRKFCDCSAKIDDLPCRRATWAIRFCHRSRESRDGTNTYRQYRFDDYFHDGVFPNSRGGSEKRNSLPQCDQQGQLHFLQFLCNRVSGRLHLRSCQPGTIGKLSPDRHQPLHRLPDVLSIPERQ